VTGRLAARDAARHGRRTGAAVAAAAIALSVPVAVSTYSSSVETFKRRTPLGHDQLLIGEMEGAGERDELVRDLEQEFPEARIVALDSSAAEDFGLQEYEAVFLMTAPDLLSPRDIERARDVSADHPGAHDLQRGRLPARLRAAAYYRHGGEPAPGAGNHGGCGCAGCFGIA